MKQTVNIDTFRQAFINMGRDNHFSYEGLEVLFDSLNQYEEDTGQELELDVIALCCEYAEMTEQEIKDNYEDVAEYDTFEDFLTDYTFYCGKTEQDTYIFQQF